ncbi:MAG: FkbM family methyltransferase [Flavobacteriaceae bacterium]|nr:FkbM family methyltransferase [Flavobacteriaceae bacterium]
MNRIKWVQFACSFFPPIISQQVREKLISIPNAEKLALDFRRKSFTGSYLQGNTSDFHAFKFLIHGYFEWRNVVLTHSILKFKKGDLVEVGANVGTETISFADINPNNKVHAYEPLPVNFKSLLTIKEQNKLEHLNLYDVLVSNKKGEAHFQIPAKNSSGSGHISSEENTKTQKFDVVTLDEHLQNVNSCAAIIADVEGFEPQILDGGANFIERTKPFLILEVNARFLKERAGISVEIFFKRLTKMGYTSFYINRLGISKVDPADFKIESNKNWICIPNEYVNMKSKLSRSIALNAFNPLLRYIIL